MIELLEGHEYSSEFEELIRIRDVSKRIFKVASPDKYKEYNGDCCRQIAYISASFLKRMIPDYEWKVYESVFIDAKSNTLYTHAYCYGKHINKKGIIVDVAFDNDIKNNYILEAEHPALPTSDEELWTRRVEIPMEYFNANEEFYTELDGRKLLKCIEQVLEAID